MSTSLLYHGFGIRGYEYVRTEYAKEQGVFYHLPGIRQVPVPEALLLQAEADKSETDRH